MPEGPTIIIACEDLQQFVGRKIKSVNGTAKLDGPVKMNDFVGQKLRSIRTWGKHLIFTFDSLAIRIHFLMFGNYRINDPKTHLKPRIEFDFLPKAKLSFYTSSVKLLEGMPDKVYDWSGDIMSKKWSPSKALSKINALPDKTMICDVLMNQDIFAGVGNIIKNETLYRTRMHPEEKIGKLSTPQLKKIIAAARVFSFQFLKWKKAFVLDDHLEIMYQKTCPKDHKVVRKTTGLGKRTSYFCPRCLATSKS